MTFPIFDFLHRAVVFNIQPDVEQGVYMWLEIMSSEFVIKINSLTPAYSATETRCS